MSEHQDFHHAPEDEATGARAWALSRDEAREAAQAATTSQLPRLPLRQTAAGALAAAAAMRPHSDAVLARLDAESGERGEVAAALDALPRLAHALRHGADVLRAAVSEADLKALVSEGEALRSKGFAAMDLLVSLGTVSRVAAAQLRQGRGRVDLAEDLQALGGVLEPHWTTLETLQAFRPADQRWTREELARMKHVGDALIEALSPTPAQSQERDDVIGLVRVLRAAYTTTRAAALYHAERAGFELELPPFGELRTLAPER